ncbi:MAG: sirohydrochlorin ferrochelatase [Pseudohongiellaceae bacterium]|jgi:sirohydrochlorin ferrochelatase
MNNLSNRLPCRGCLQTCKYYNTCEGKLWRMPVKTSVSGKLCLGKDQKVVNMKQLLIVAHGSRIESSNQEVRVLAEKVGARLKLEVDDIKVAFLELASPSIDVALSDCFNRGVKEVVVLPYFLSGGNHVMNDIPQEVHSVLDKWPDKTITVLPHIGASEAMVNLITEAY